MRFHRSSTLAFQLTSDLVAAHAALEAMRSQRLGNGTAYVPAMQSVEAEVIARGDRVNRNQRCLFLSDGQPQESLAQTDAKAADLAALSVVMDTFALGFPTSPSLQNMAAITGGTFTPLAPPGDIVGLLPDFLPAVPRTFTSRNDLSGGSGPVSLDDSSGTFSVTVTLVPGTNHVVLTLTANGVDPVTVECAIDVILPVSFVGDAGAPQSACRGTRVMLDASRSLVATCASPLYRWLDCSGNEICPTSAVPTCEVDACSGCADFTLEVTCGPACATTAATRLDCLAQPAVAPTVLRACGLDADLACGADPALTSAWDLDPSVDSNLDGVPANDPDILGCDVSVAFTAFGSNRVVAIVADDATGCSASQELSVNSGPPPDPRDLDGGLCPGALADLTCGSPRPGSAYWWDLDGDVDGDGDGDTHNDADANGCDASTSWPGDGSYAVAGWERDASGCVFLVAEGTLIVAAGAVPGEVPDLRLSRQGEGIGLTWAAVPGSQSYRVARGTIARLWDLREYDHAADDVVGQGRCDSGGGRSHDDPDDVADPTPFYYLVTSTNGCGGEGISGMAWDGRQSIPRPGRQLSASCP